jgi:hypothetical protein
MSARRRSPRTRLLGCLADRRLHQAHLDTGTLTVAVAIEAGGITSTATDDDDKPNMLRAGSADLHRFAIGLARELTTCIPGCYVARKVVGYGAAPRPAVGIRAAAVIS